VSRGIDVSHHNGIIDWQKVKADGIDFAIIRCGYGQIEDREFKKYIDGAIKAGIPVGIYYFSYALNAQQAKDEAAHCMKLIKPYKIDLPVYFDFEYDSETFAAKKGVTYTKSLRTDIHKAFCDAIKAGGYKPGIYTNIDYITNRIDWNALKGCSLWLAQWPLGGSRNIKFEEVIETAVNTKYGKPDIWQIGKGRIGGISTDTDFNYGYVPLPDKQPVKPAEPKPIESPLKAGDKVAVINTTKALNLRRGNLYGGGTFVVYRDSYDVIQVNGDRVVIGVGKAVTAAVNTKDLKKL
jgi:GH25 family lysozyme M1 (1,4-beta-N-acetylmuramidase)